MAHRAPESERVGAAAGELGAPFSTRARKVFGATAAVKRVAVKRVAAAAAVGREEYFLTAPGGNMQADEVLLKAAAGGR